MLLLKQWRTPKLGRARPDAFEFSPKTERSILGAASSPLLRENAAAASTSASPSVALKVPLLKQATTQSRKPPNMWSREYIALYAHYACVGFVQAIVGGALVPYCLYVAKGQPNTCATLSTFVNLPFGFKLFYGTISDCVPLNASIASRTSRSAGRSHSAARCSPRSTIRSTSRRRRRSSSSFP